MASLQSTYMNIASENGCENPHTSRKKLKELIMEEILNVEFCQPWKVNESKHVVLNLLVILLLQKQKLVTKVSVVSSKVYSMLLKF